MKRILVGLLVLIVLVVAGFSIFVASRQHLTFDAPLPNVTASTDSAVIARGEYVVRVVGSCSGCHSDPATHDRVAAGEDTPLSGGFEFAIPPGKFYPRNITPDEETGIGRFSDGQLARALRYGVGHDGRALLPFMEMQGLSDEDLVAVVSYLRAQPPVHHVVPAHQYNLLGKIVKATVLANPVGPKDTPPTTNPHGATVENGKYLVEAVAICWSCHTERDFKTGAMIGAHLAGGHLPDDFNPKRMWAPPNITPDPATGKLAQYSEDEFVARFRNGAVIPGTPMPWNRFKRMSDEDLRAIYRYLKTVPPAVNDVGAPFVDQS